MSINSVSERVSQPLVSSFEPSKGKTLKEKDVKSAESADKTMVNVEDVKGEVEKLNSIVKNYNHKLNFDVDQKTNQVVVKIVDGETDKIIRQIPPDEILNLSQRMDELRGMIFDDGG